MGYGSKGRRQASRLGSGSPKSSEGNESLSQQVLSKEMSHLVRNRVGQPGQLPRAPGLAPEGTRPSIMAHFFNVVSVVCYDKK